MSANMMICTAPCCWGVDDVSNPHLPHWRTVLDEARGANFAGLELGPYGYMPLEVETTAVALADNNLSIVAGTIFDNLVDPQNRRALLQQAEQICAFIKSLPAPQRFEGQRYDAPYLTVMDWGHDERDYAAGHSDRAPRLNNEQWSGMIGNICAIAELARDKFGVRAVVHPHAGGYIEFEDEIDKLVMDVSATVAGLCIDTGHAAYSGMDPVSTLEKYWDRIDYIHFKDIDPDVFDAVMGERIRFFDACAKGVMCPIGQGSIDYADVYRFLTAKNYAGYITVEQERDPQNQTSVLKDLGQSRAYLAAIGFDA